MYDIVSLLGEGYNLRDITILVRNNSETEIVAQLLFSNNLDFISADSLFLDKSPAIRLLLSLLHYLSDTRNNLAKTELLHIYLDYFHENHGKGISEILNDFNLSGNSIYDEFIPRKFRDNVASLSSLPLYELLESLLSIFGLDIVPDPYIQRFREVVLEFNRKHKLSIRFFLEWWEESKYSVVMPDDMNAIKVMKASNFRLS